MATVAPGQNPVCCSSPPVTHDYVLKGAWSKLSVGGKDIDTYFSGTGSMGVVLITDIFGLDDFKQTLQVADRLAAAGMAVAVPDVFDHKPWPMSKIPMKPEDNFMGWVEEHRWEVTRLHVLASVEALKAKGATKFGCLGFCWGAAMAMQAGADSTFSAVGGGHPSLFGQDQALSEGLKCPVILLSAKGDPMESVKAVTDTLPIGSKCVFQRFDDMEHGFLAARGQWTDAKIAARATEAIDIFVSFLKANLA